MLEKVAPNMFYGNDQDSLVNRKFKRTAFFFFKEIFSNIMKLFTLKNLSDTKLLKSSSSTCLRNLKFETLMLHFIYI